MKIKYKKLILLLNITINHISLCSGQESSPGSLLSKFLGTSPVASILATAEFTQQAMKPEEMKEGNSYLQQKQFIEQDKVLGSEIQQMKNNRILQIQERKQILQQQVQKIEEHLEEQLAKLLETERKEIQGIKQKYEAIKQLLFIKEKNKTEEQKLEEINKLEKEQLELVRLKEEQQQLQQKIKQDNLLDSSIELIEEQDNLLDSSIEFELIGAQDNLLKPYSFLETTELVTINNYNKK